MGQLFFEDFEANNLNQWTVTRATAAIVNLPLHFGNYFLECLSDAGNEWVQVRSDSWGPVAECWLRLFWSPIEALVKAGSVQASQYIFTLLNAALGQKVAVYREGYEDPSDQVRLRARFYADDGSSVYTALEDCPYLDRLTLHCLEFHFKAATAPGANDGVEELLVNGLSVGKSDALDTDTISLNNIILWARETATLLQSTEHFDNIEVNTSRLYPPDYACLIEGASKPLAVSGTTATSGNIDHEREASVIRRVRWAGQNALTLKYKTAATEGGLAGASYNELSLLGNDSLPGKPVLERWSKWQVDLTEDISFNNVDVSLSRRVRRGLGQRQL